MCRVEVVQSAMRDACALQVNERNIIHNRKHSGQKSNQNQNQNAKNHVQTIRWAQIIL